MKQPTINPLQQAEQEAFALVVAVYDGVRARGVEPKPYAEDFIARCNGEGLVGDLLLDLAYAYEAKNKFEEDLMSAAIEKIYDQINPPGVGELTGDDSDPE